MSSIYQQFAGADRRAKVMKISKRLIVFVGLLCVITLAIPSHVFCQAQGAAGTGTAGAGAAEAGAGGAGGAGAAAGAATTTGVSAGTIAIGIGIAAIVVGVGIAIHNGGTSGGGTTSNH